MIALPPPLAPWRHWLSWFDAALAAELGRLLLRLHPLLGRAGRRAQAGEREPDGIDDLRVRGRYERLLLSEWVLADELPEEFLRRAAHNEHLFLAPRLRARESERRLIAVFDSGPAQWGAPRLLHVAMWILLAQRAQGQGARFSWGLAHRPGVLHDETAPAALQGLLQGRTHELAGAEALQAWQAAFERDAPRAERWLCSRQALDGAPFSHHAAIREDFDGRLRVRVGPLRALREAVLERPASRHSSWLLRGHFSQPRAAQHRSAARGRLALRQPPLWSSSGRHLALPLLGERCVATFTLPGDGQKKRAGPRYLQWRAGAELAGGALSETVFGGLVTSHRSCTLWNLGKFQAAAFSLDDLIVRPGMARWLSCAWLSGTDALRRFLVLDHARRLHVVTSKAQRSCIATEVFALLQIDALRAVFVQVHGDTRLGVQLFGSNATRQLARWPVAGLPAAVHVLPRLRGNDWVGTVCVEEAQSRREGARATRCLLFQSSAAGQREVEVLVPPGAKVIGVMTAADDAQDGVLALRGDKRALLWHGAGRAETVYESVHDICAASVSPRGDRVAFVDLSGRLTVLADHGRSVLYRVAPEGEHG